ncbi:PepSY-associated TM helix domain-containing protein [Aestuariibacter sp. A3R04]|uniref:PepSY-associated TM helix domain-containing protein n=1 Tax=Aestuariibacter sp. A3R04 TaxID=2841571 RepID=UPI001C09AFC4|nr:PepSY-associated TM helix domain-containing protein [Aestuariibacter sp. A3R04]MBU3021947.1 PepSY-associated TM helix domain-containing protein [Aestuariibacter sp. A3R04]
MRISLGSARQWHWISAAICLAGMLMFAVTGITLNHAADIEVEPETRNIEATLPANVLESLTLLPQGNAGLPSELTDWLVNSHSINPPSNKEAEWDGVELYMSWPGPGQDHWFAIDGETGKMIYEGVDRGWIAYFNDLHKGRNTGVFWQWFLDIFSVIVIIFTVTGLQLLIKQAPHKASTWPVTALGLLIPVFIMLVFIH